MSDPFQCLGGQWEGAVEEFGAKPRSPQRGGFLGRPAGAADNPALGGEPARQRLRGVAEAEGEEMAGHAGFLAGTAAGSTSKVVAIRSCLNRVHTQKPQETSAPTASGSRRPKWPLSEPISTAPTAGPARKIIP